MAPKVADSSSAVHPKCLNGSIGRAGPSYGQGCWFESSLRYHWSRFGRDTMSLPNRMAAVLQRLQLYRRGNTWVQALPESPNMSSAQGMLPEARPQYAGVVKLADAPDSKSGATRHVGSIPTAGTRGDTPSQQSLRIPPVQLSGRRLTAGTQEVLLPQREAGGMTRFSIGRRVPICGRGETGRRAGLKPRWSNPCGFNSRRPHHMPQ